MSKLPPNIEFGLSEETRQTIDSVRAHLSIIYSMALANTSDSCNELSMNDLVEVLCHAEQRLKGALKDVVSIR